MGQVHELYAEFSRMRDSGMEAKQALNILRPHIETLTKADREELANLVRARESGSVAPAVPAAANSDSQMKKKVPIKPVVSAAPPPPPATAPPPPVAKPASSPEAKSSALGIKPLKKVTEEKKAPADNNIVWVTCPNCGKTNQKHEVFCYACGQILEPVKGVFDTRHFSETDEKPVDAGFFGPDSVLALRIRGSAEPYEVRPQKIDHEVIVGRSVEGSPMMPDVDLHDKKAADLGVSRFHLSVRYDAEQEAILVSDLGSANGTFINGQRLMAKEIRVLRHGDELRLGKLVLAVSFRHPTGPLQD